MSNTTDTNAATDDITTHTFHDFLKSFLKIVVLLLISEVNVSIFKLYQL